MSIYTESQEQFKEEIRHVVRREIAALKRDGTVGMSLDNLWQVTVRDISHCKHAPTGTNEAYYAKQTFDAVVLETFKRFIV